MDDLTLGISAMGYAVAGLFFLRFWKSTRDRLFALFCAAFWLLGIQSILLSTENVSTEEATPLFVVRLIAFLLILYGIIDKNYLQARRSRRG